MALDFHCHWS